MTHQATDPIEHTLSATDAKRLLGLADQLRRSYRSPDHPDLAARAPLVVRGVPDDLLLFLRAFTHGEPAGAAVVRGLPVDDDALGRTPLRFDPPRPRAASVVLDFYATLIAYCLAQPYRYASLQGGRLVHNVLPVPGREEEKSGTSSRSTLELHTEDAAHPARPRYLILLAARNDDAVPTSYASLAQAHLDPEQVKVLFQPRFTMRSEPDHVVALGESQRLAVLFGHPADPYLRYDGFYLSADATDPTAQRALSHLGERLQKAATKVHLQPGDLLIVNNFRAVHGRDPFTARYDGRDRWLKRILVGDPQDSRAWRPSAGSLVIDLSAGS